MIRRVLRTLVLLCLWIAFAAWLLHGVTAAMDRYDNALRLSGINPPSFDKPRVTGHFNFITPDGWLASQTPPADVTDAQRHALAIDTAAKWNAETKLDWLLKERSELMESLRHLWWEMLAAGALAFVVIGWRHPSPGRTPQPAWVGVLGIVIVGVPMLVSCAPWLLAGRTWGAKEVIVTDPSGHALAAAVQVVSLSINYASILTDGHGHADVSGPYGQTPKWISISAPGYRAASLDWPAKWPLLVTLSPAAFH